MRDAALLSWLTPYLLAVVMLLGSSGARAQLPGLWAGTENLPLVRHDLHLEVTHPVAETILTQEFDNPHPRNLEATFVYPVPAGAVVTGLALWVKGERREARLLERRVATEIYEGIVGQKRDPALLERIDGNTFRIRIFPVVARSRARIELRFAQPVEPAAGNGYRVTLRRPPGPPLHVLRLSIALRAPFLAEGVRLRGLAADLRRGPGGWFLPRSPAPRSFVEDIQLSYSPPASFGGLAVASATLGGERLLVAEVPVAPEARRARRLALLLDLSRSMEPHLPRLRGLGRALLERLTPADQLALVPFGLLPREPARLLAAEAEQRLRWRGKLNDLRAAGGASFLPAWRAACAAGARRLVLVTDGGSAYHAEELEQLLREHADHPGVQVSTVALPGAHNEEQLKALARRSGGVEARLERDEDLAALAQQLLEAPRPPGLILEGGRALLLGRTPGRLLVAGSLPEGSRRGLLRLHTGEALWLELPDEADTTARQPAGRAVAALFGDAAIEEQMSEIRLFGESPALREEVVRLSLRYRIVSEYTALLATETDADYLRPTSGEPWQRRLPRAGDDLAVSGFQSTPEPHELALLAAALLLLAARSWRGRLRGPAFAVGRHRPRQ